MKKSVSFLLAMAIVLSFGSCSGEKTYTKKEWEALQSKTQMSLADTTTSAAPPSQTTTTTGQKPTSKTGRTTTTTKTTTKAPTTRTTTSASTTRLTVPPVAVPEQTYEEALHKLEAAYRTEKLKAAKDRDAAENTKNQSTINFMKTQQSIHREIDALKRQKDKEVGEMVANAGGYMSTAAKAAEKHYNDLIEDKLDELRAADKEHQQVYAVSSQLYEELCQTIAALEKQEKEDIAALKEKYGIA